MLALFSLGVLVKGALTFIYLNKTEKKYRERRKIEREGLTKTK